MEVYLFSVAFTVHLAREDRRSQCASTNPLVLDLFDAGAKRIWEVLQTLVLLWRPPDREPPQLCEGVNHAQQCSVLLWHTGNRDLDASLINRIYRKSVETRSV